MRTTLTLDPDVAERIRQETLSKRVPLKKLINDSLRAGLGMAAPRQSKPFRVEPHSSGYLPGIDRMKLNQTADDLEAETFGTHWKRKRK